VNAERVIPGVGTLEFVETPKRREYWLLPEDGKRRLRIPSVTTILRETLPKPGLVPWAAGLGPDYARARDEAAERGTVTHQFIAHYLQTGDLLTDPPEKHAPYLAAAARFLFEHDPKPLAVEQLVCHPEMRYAGRLDLIAEIDGQPTLLDFKTNPNGRVYLEAHVQTTAYAIAATRCGDPTVTRTLLIGLAGTGEYTVTEGVNGWKLWGAALALYGELHRLQKTLNGDGE
jgi:hypothetical protein